jgi:hypothetical protein
MVQILFIFNLFLLLISRISIASIYSILCTQYSILNTTLQQSLFPISYHPDGYHQQHQHFQ